MAQPTLAFRGILANVQAGLALRFQFNPTRIKHNKEVNYSVTPIPGWDHPDIVFESGGLRTIRFDLMFDRSGQLDQGFVGPSDKSNFQTIGKIPLVGTDAVKAIIESFLYPERAGILDIIGGVERYKPPPRGILIMGTRFHEVIVQGGQDMEDMLLDPTLTPIRLFTSLSFMIVEEGVLNEVDTARRNLLAKTESILSLADVVTETFSRLPPGNIG